MKRILTILLLCLAVFSVSAQSRQVSYLALVLDSVSSERMKVFAQEHAPWPDAELYCHHMTIAHHTNLTPEIMQWVREHEGFQYAVETVDFGFSDKAFAVKVKSDQVPSVNAITHVTLATHTSAGGKAVDSNYITEWIPFPQRMLLTGRITIIYK